MSKGLNEKSGRSLMEDADKGAVPSANQRRWGFENFLGIGQLRKEHVFVLSGIALVLIVGAIWSIRYEGWEEEQERQLMEIRAEAQRLEQRAIKNLNPKLSDSAKEAPKSNSQTLAFKSVNVPDRGTIGVIESAQQKEPKLPGGIKTDRAKQQFAYAQRVLADLNRLVPYAKEIETRHRYLQTKAGMLGAGGFYGWGADMARRVAQVPVIGCAEQVKAVLISNANSIDDLALAYMNLSYREIDDIWQHRRNQLFSSSGQSTGGGGGIAQECERLANADLQYFGGIR